MARRRFGHRLAVALAILILPMAGCARPVVESPAMPDARLTVDGIVDSDLWEVEREYSQAIARGDHERRLSLVTETYSYISPFGARIGHADLVTETCDFEFWSLAEVLDVHASADGAMVTVTARTRALRMPSAERTLITTRVWTRTADGWKAVHGQQTFASRALTPSATCDPDDHLCRCGYLPVAR